MAKVTTPPKAAGVSESIQYRDYARPETDPLSILTPNVDADGNEIDLSTLDLSDPDFDPFTLNLKQYELISWVIGDWQAKATTPGLTRFNLEVGFFYYEEDGELDHGKQWDMFIGSKKLGLYVSKSMEQVIRIDQIPEVEGRPDIFMFARWLPDVQGERFRSIDLLHVVQHQPS